VHVVELVEHVAQFPSHKEHSFIALSYQPLGQLLKFAQVLAVNSPFEFFKRISPDLQLVHVVEVAEHVAQLLLHREHSL